jgi:hypothetical protein
MFTLALAITCVQSALAQTFKQVKVIGKPAIAQVASGGTSAWALASTGQPYVFNGKVFTLANTISLSQIAVGGGNAAQADTVWALNSSGNIFRASKILGKWAFSQVPGVLDLIQVGPGYEDSCHPYEVWGLNTSSQIYRFDFCGGNFVQVPGILCDIKVGGGEIWGAQCGPQVYRFDFATGVFDKISVPFASFPALTVGANGVWAIDTSSGGFYQYDAFLGFEGVTCCLSQVQAGGDGVWALSGNTIYRFKSNVLTFEHVPGSLASLSVGSGGGVWGINSSHQVYAFTTP